MAGGLAEDERSMREVLMAQRIARPLAVSDVAVAALWTRSAPTRRHGGRLLPQVAPSPKYEHPVLARSSSEPFESTSQQCRVQRFLLSKVAAIMSESRVRDWLGVKVKNHEPMSTETQREIMLWRPYQKLVASMLSSPHWQSLSVSSQSQHALVAALQDPCGEL